MKKTISRLIIVLSLFTYFSVKAQVPCTVTVCNGYYFNNNDLFNIYKAVVGSYTAIGTGTASTAQTQTLALIKKSLDTTNQGIRSVLRRLDSLSGIASNKSYYNATLTGAGAIVLGPVSGKHYEIYGYQINGYSTSGPGFSTIKLTDGSNDFFYCYFPGYVDFDQPFPFINYAVTLQRPVRMSQVNILSLNADATVALSIQYRLVLD